eukprot:TRINITY_DN863_c0_g2_i2.p1 TRINITY_DN863_c0_g2~~TRINITY_DN863_c0_g2_i2.p1  ORF type:complete len:484 (-),score=157.39 TRINITY_DN863_c0_g2_i2:438-1889(-)
MPNLGKIAGTVNGSFFAAPEWVDKEKPPGTTSQSVVYGQPGWWIPLVTAQHMIWSPNLVWFLCTVVVYFAFPYDYEAAKTWSFDWVAHRLTINLVATFGYVGFWHVTLYHLGWAKRPFKDGREYRWAKVFHNMWYTFLGVVQWTAWEVGFVRMYATGTLPYISDRQAFSSIGNVAYTLFCAAAVPAWRELHFYFAHRFIHTRALYKYVHSLHHRNTDIEPFAGLSMHPIEHLYYFSCVGPSLLVPASPFMMLWNGYHLILSPAASHSGWEDNLQSDQFHYLHHRYFECNYGTGGIPWDKLFGTYRDRLNPPSSGAAPSSTYRGASEEATDVKSAAIADTKASLLGLPDMESAVFMAASAAIFAVFAAAVLGYPSHAFWRVSYAGVSAAHWVALLVSAGPVLVGVAIMTLADRRGAVATLSEWRKAYLYPFHREALFGAFGLHLVMGVVLCVVPTYVFVVSALAAEAPTGSAAAISTYCQLWRC